MGFNSAFKGLTEGQEGPLTKLALGIAVMHHNLVSHDE